MSRLERTSAASALVVAEEEQGARGFESLHSLHHHQQQSSFHQFLLQSMTPKTAEDRLRYAKRFGNVLTSGNASILLQLSPELRMHAMKSLSALAKFNGEYEQWQQMRRRYNLKWSTGDSLQHFQRFFCQDLTLDAMIERIKQMIAVLPAPMGKVVRFATLTGLRPTEACESVRLINDEVSGNIITAISGQIKAPYYDPEQQTLRHYLYPDIYLRATKKCYLSYLSVTNYQRIAKMGCITPLTLNAIRQACRRRGLKMEMKLCRRVFSSWLLEQGIPEVAIDMLSGRVSTSVFRNHYATPDASMKDKVLQSVSLLSKKLDNVPPSY